MYLTSFPQRNISRMSHCFQISSIELVFLMAIWDKSRARFWSSWAGPSKGLSVNNVCWTDFFPPNINEIVAFNYFVVVVVSWVGTKIQRENKNQYRGRLNQMQAFGLSPYNFCVDWKVVIIIRVNQVTRHPSSIGSDKPSKDPEIRQVRKLHSNAQKWKKSSRK